MAFAATLLFSLIGFVGLQAGIADPPRAGSHRLTMPTPDVWILAAHETRSVVIMAQLPAPPFTLEVTARFSAESLHNAAWALWLPEPITIYNNHLFSIANGKRAPFIHLQSSGSPNQLTLNVLADHTATLRLNDEIAWQGSLAAQQWSIAASNNSDMTATLVWETLVIYTPP